jgi:DNA-binding CsgD family transcriptional regulator
MLDLGKDETVELINFATSLSFTESVETLRIDILRKLIKFFQCSCGQFFRTLTSGKQLNIETGVSCNIPDKLHLSFKNHYYKYSPFHLPNQFDSKHVLTGEQILSNRELFEHTYYLKFLKPQSLYHQMIIPLWRKTHLIGVIYLYRKKEQSKFSIAEKQKAELLIPALSTSLDHALMKVKSRGLRTVIESLLKDLPYEGLIILNQSLEPVYSSEYAEKVFFHSVDVVNNPDEFHNMMPIDLIQKCNNLLDSSKDEQEAVIDKIEFNRFSFPDDSDSAVALKCMKFDFGDKYILIRLSKEEPILSLSQRLKKLGVSSRELDVVFLVYQGLKNGEIADKLFISEHTVENHLRAIYHKMDVKNRTSLIHELIQLGRDRSYLIPFQDSPSL